MIASFIWWDVILSRIGLRGWARRNRPERMRKAARSFRKEAVRLGGVMIKVGQFMSSRLDVLPADITNELAGLQDEVQPEPFASIRRNAEIELGVPLEERFEFFDPEPMAAASIGQVHKARLILPDGHLSDVVVKVQRSDIENIIKVDLSALNIVGGWLFRYKPIRKRVNVPALLSEFGKTTLEEVDYLNEGKNAERFAENFRESPEIKVPKVFWNTTTRRVLTLEDVQRIKISDYAAIDSAGIDRKEVAERLFGCYLQQILEHRFFHADPHPGNLFISPEAKKIDGEKTPWRLVFIDFGMTGSITDKMVAGLREGLIAIGTGDAARLIKAYQLLDMLLPSADTELLTRASQAVFEQFWGKATTQMMDMHQEQAVKLLNEFGDLLYELPFQVPENLILLGRCVSILSGMCSGLYPEFNLWTSVFPYARKLLTEETGTGVKLVLKQVTDFVQVTAGLPRRIDSVISRMENGRLEVRTPDLRVPLGRIDRGLSRLASSVVFAALTLGGVQLYLAGQMMIAAGFGAAAVIALGFTVFGRLRQ